MRIAFYSPRASHLDLELSRGGDPVFLHGLFAALRSRGHEINLISRLNVRDVWRGGISLRDLGREAIAIRRRMKRFSPDAWLVYNASRTYPDLFGWWQPTRRYVLLSAHSWQSAKVPKRWRWILAYAHRRALKRADFVTVVRNDTGERLRKRGVDQGRLRLLPPSAAVVDDVPTQKDARRRLGFPPDVCIVFCATRFTAGDDRKQGKTEMVLDLLSIMPPLPSSVLLVLAGDGPGRTRIQAEIERLNLAERVRLVGSVDNSDMKWFFAACDLYAYPYAGDIPSVSVLEAQGHGCPAITMRTSSGELTVGPGTTGLLAESLEEFREHLAALAQDRTRCAEMGKEARRFVSGFHSTEVRAREIEELLSG
jgi:glycosyltransferase involved in cell wall biosynthesis